MQIPSPKEHIQKRYSTSYAIVLCLVAQSCPTLCNPVDYSPGQNTGVGSLSLLQEILPIQGSNPGLPHCRWILYHLSHQGSPEQPPQVTADMDRSSCSNLDQDFSFSAPLRFGAAIVCCRCLPCALYDVEQTLSTSALVTPPLPKL